MNNDSLSRKHYLLIICLMALLIQIGYSQSSSDSLTSRNSPDTLFGNTSWSVGIALGEGVGILGAKVSYRLSNQWWLTAGAGYFSISLPSTTLGEFNFITLPAVTRTEFSIMLTLKYFTRKHIYLMTGLSLKFRHAKIRLKEHISTETVAPIGIPLAFGFDLRSKDGTAFNIECGYAQYFGRGANDIDLIINTANGTTKSTFPGSSGFWFGAGINYYF